MEKVREPIRGACTASQCALDSRPKVLNISWSTIFHINSRTKDGSVVQDPLLEEDEAWDSVIDVYRNGTQTSKLLARLLAYVPPTSNEQLESYACVENPMPNRSLSPSIPSCLPLDQTIPSPKRLSRPLVSMTLRPRWRFSTLVQILHKRYDVRSPYPRVKLDVDVL